MEPDEGLVAERVCMAYRSAVLVHKFPAVNHLVNRNHYGQSLSQPLPHRFPLRDSIANAGGAEGLLASVGNTWRILGEKVGKVDLPRMYCAVGKNDFLYDRYLEFKAYAQDIGADITFEEFEGFTHEWRFWDLTIQKALTFFGLDATDQGNPF